MGIDYSFQATLKLCFVYENIKELLAYGYLKRGYGYFDDYNRPLSFENAAHFIIDKTKNKNDDVALLLCTKIQDVTLHMCIYFVQEDLMGIYFTTRYGWQLQSGEIDTSRYSLELLKLCEPFKVVNFQTGQY